MSKEKKAGRPVGTKKSMTKRALIKEISDVCGLKRSITKSVIDAFSDILIRESVSTGQFHLANCFSINTATRRARKAYNVNANIYEDFPETEYLTIKLSPKINGWFRWKTRNIRNVENGVTKDNWRDAMNK